MQIVEKVTHLQSRFIHIANLDLTGGMGNKWKGLPVNIDRTKCWHPYIAVLIRAKGM